MLVDDLLIHSAERAPGKAAVVCGDRRVAYGSLDQSSNRLANALLEMGLGRGDRVAVLLDNSPEVAVAVFGILKASGAFVVLNSTTKIDKLAYILNDCSARALITGRSNEEMVETVLSRVGSLDLVMCTGIERDPPPRRPVVDFERHLSGFPSTLPQRNTVDADLAALIYTSGSTGVPKGVAVSHLNIVSAARSITTYLENVSDDVIMNVLPLSFDYGLYQLLMATMVGATLVLEKSFAYPFSIVEKVRRESVTGFPGVPTIFSMLTNMTEIDPAYLDSVRYVTNTAAALPPAHIEQLGSLFRNARLYSMYGLTECKRVSYLDPNEIGRRPTSVGKAMPDVEVRVVDEGGRPVAPGETGELVVRGPNVMIGYWNRPQDTAAVIRPVDSPGERWLFTGDLFTVDDDGFLYFVARKDDVFKSRGEKVSPTEVERVIQEMPGVREAVVFGVVDPLLGQAVKAVVVRREGSEISERDIIDHCASRLENFMVPSSVEFAASLPVTETGKVRRKTLSDERIATESEDA
jgi:long-chain acyl-CoA synthetase